MIKFIINFYRLVPAIIILFFTNKSTKEKVFLDLCAYQNYHKKFKKVSKKSFYLIFSYILISDLTYKSVFLYRLENYKIKKLIFKFFWNPLKTIEIHSIKKDGIDGGLWISHNYCVVSVYSAGKNLRIGPGVTIGMKNNGKDIINPIIGDNVYVATNSTVIGGINIGDNVTIGAGSVVIKEVKANCIVAGNPAHIIKEGDKNE